MKRIIVLVVLAWFKIDYLRGMDPDQYFMLHYFPLWRTWTNQGRAWAEIKKAHPISQVDLTGYTRPASFMG